MAEKCRNGYEYTLHAGEIIGFVYPIYAWAPPRIVLDFISKLKLLNYKDHYIFSTATCGDDTGNSLKVLRKCLQKRALEMYRMRYMRKGMLQ